MTEPAKSTASDTNATGTNATGADRRFADRVVRTLRDAGHEALFAGGCVRDQLLGTPPKDFDVATSATPDQVRVVFGKRRTLPIGAAFGVITVLGPKGVAPIEVATFRQDGDYHDGRRPDAVAFADAEHDASRRDFTINGLFFDPIEERVIDYVGGRDDLAAGVVRAIGDPAARFDEDKLRMLRAVRFAATLGFAIDPATADAIRTRAGEIAVVSAERIGAELRRLLTHAECPRGLTLLDEVGLLPHVLPEFDANRLAPFAETHGRLATRTVAASLACSLKPAGVGRVAIAAAKRLKFTNREAERAGWLVDNALLLEAAETRPWSAVQPLLAHDGAAELVAVYEALRGADEASRFCREKLALPKDALDPPPVLSGDDLIRAGFRPGPAFARLLRAVRAAQLDGEIADAEAALAFARRLADGG